MVLTDRILPRTANRRSFLRTVAGGAAAATAGCAGAGGFVSAIRPHVHNEDAPVDDSAGAWSSLGADPRRTGAIPDGDPPTGDRPALEVTPLGPHHRSQPVVADGRVYAGVGRRSTEASDEEFTGLIAADVDPDHRDGTVAWRSADNGPAGSYTPAVRGRVVYAADGEGLAALDARDGDVYWRNAAGGPAPAVLGEDCVTADGDGAVALDAVTGEVNWRSEEPSAAPSGVAVADDAVLLSAGDGGDGALYCFERDDGSTRWRYADVGESYAAPVTDGERAYAVGTDGTLHAVTLADGERAWSYETGPRAYHHVAVAGETVYVPSEGGDQISALAADDGRPRWRQDVGIGGSASPAVVGDAVLVRTTTRDGRRLLVLARSDGSERASVDVPDGLGHSVQPVVADGAAYVVAEPPEETQAVLYAVE